jgi:DNA-binding transcriptional LysR family regulator
MHLNLKSLQMFLAVAETRSFRKAADQVHRSQSAVSMQIKHLEEHLGIALFHRTTRQVRLTPEGEHLLGATRRAMAELEVGLDRIREALDMQTGRLSLGCVPTISASVLPSILSAYQRDFPGIAINLRELPATELVQAVTRQDVEFGVGPAIPWASDVAFQAMATDPIYALVPTHGTDAPRSAIRLEELARLPLLMYATAASLRGNVEREFAVRNLKFDIRCEILHASTLVAFARAGLGVAILPKVSIPARLGQRLRALPIVEPSLERLLGVIKLRGQSLSPAAQRLADMIVAHFTKAGGRT